ncbi:MAG: chemotaxis protein CheA [Proteobacteria bacterium]|nr:chemotaxis protein CheA [Pseudomonadota bacterium]MBU1715222.1 chemotaxis protein CheA [Pseudomonadota bacterium]
MQDGITDTEALKGFIDESNESIQAVESDFIELGNNPGNLEIINNIFRPVHSLKGNSGFFGLTNINKFAHRLENLLDHIRKGDLLANREVIDTLLTGIDFLKEMLNRAYADPGDIELRSDETEFLEHVERLRPVEETGSIQSIIDLEKSLQEAMDAGLDIHHIPLINNLLTHIEKSNREIIKITDDYRSAAQFENHHPGNRYFLGEKELTEEVGCLLLAQAKLRKKNNITGELLGEFKGALRDFAEIFSSDPKTSQTIDELISLANFVDDQLMVSNEEFINNIMTDIHSIIDCFQIKEREGNDNGIPARIGDILVEQNLVSEQQIKEVLIKQKKIGQLLVEDGTIAKNELQRALDIQNQRLLSSHLTKSKKTEITKTIRIDQDKLDSFANAVGNLFINLESITFLKKELEKFGTDQSLIAKLDNTIRSVDESVESLHDKIMGIRRVPLNKLFQRFPRVIRQLAGSLDKDINFTISGEETVIDKDIVEKIENPLVHILRNSVDHGIEKPEERSKNNKASRGNLELKASSDENNIYITITDDGQGIDPAKMKEIAVTKNFLSKEEADQLNDRELINLIFKPSFSSAQKVTDVSGRGVGMDVVMSGLKASNGAIDIDSTVGKGTRVTITIPLTKTLVTKDAMIIKSGGQTYVIPSDDITTVIERTEIIPVLSEGCLQYDGSLYRLVNINDFFSAQTKGSTAQKQTIKTFALSKNHQIAIMVDQVLNHQKVVVKDFKDGYRNLNNIDGINGYTIMGNDEIILIIDVEKLAQQSLGEST